VEPACARVPEQHGSSRLENSIMLNLMMDIEKNSATMLQLIFQFAASNQFFRLHQRAEFQSCSQIS
jgi:hypothetical protein